LTKIEPPHGILKAVKKKKHITYKGKPIKIIADFSMEKLKARHCLLIGKKTLKP
jgi:ribonucleotide monophosphatase NagD (HAD superfamily)